MRTATGPTRSFAARASFLVVALVLMVCGAHAQSQKQRDLEKQRAALDQQIKTTTALIEQARREQRATQEQLQLLEGQIRAREQLIGAMHSELRLVERRIAEDEDMVRDLGADLDALREAYAGMVRFAYRNRSGYDRMSYLFAAESFQQAWQRGRYLAQLSEQRRRQAALIEETRAGIDERLAALREQRDLKARLMEEQRSEKQRLAADRQGRQGALETLKREEGRLREAQRRQENRRKELDAAIRKAIEEEMRKAKGTTTRPDGRIELSLTPEARELNADFEKNKGKLPWPVEKGVITSGYGPQKHPVLRDVTIDNNGIDITTEKSASVRAVFRGEVTSVLVMPGAGKAVIISHGAYRTVYSNLASVTVTKGQKVDTKQVLGTVISDDEGSKAHLEVWRIGTDGKLNHIDPAQWLYR
jgi:septal ring factor EnvC (AmiA/AmiB activator)